MHIAWKLIYFCIDFWIKTSEIGNVSRNIRSFLTNTNWIVLKFFNSSMDCYYDFKRKNNTKIFMNGSQESGPISNDYPLQRSGVKTPRITEKIYANFIFMEIRKVHFLFTRIIFQINLLHIFPIFLQILFPFECLWAEKCHSFIWKNHVGKSEEKSIRFLSNGGFKENISIFLFWACVEAGRGNWICFWELSCWEWGWEENSLRGSFKESAELSNFLWSSQIGQKNSNFSWKSRNLNYFDFYPKNISTK